MGGPVVLINPNTNTATTAMMTDIARPRLAEHGLRVVGRTVACGPTMITEPVALAAAAGEVVTAGTLALREIPDAAGIIVGAFADPGLPELARAVDVPVVGIAGAALRAASAGGRRFGIATVAPALVPAMTELIQHYGCAAGCTGVRAADISPQAIAADPDALLAAMVELAGRCAAEDGAEVVVIGGGPLGAVAEAIRTRLAMDTVSPIPAACAEIAALV